MAPRATKSILTEANEVYRRQVRAAFTHHPGFGGSPPENIPGAIKHCLQMLARRVTIRGSTALDLGCGLNTWAALLRHLGATVQVADTFDPWRTPASQPFLTELIDYYSRLDVGVHEFDIQKGHFPFEDGTFDVVTCFHVIEHFHHTPRFTYEEAYRVLKPGGVFFVVMPNAVNVRKRVRVILGRTNYHRFDRYYDNPVYFWHVREPVLSEVKECFVRNGFKVAAVSGRNYLGFDRLVHADSAVTRALGTASQAVVGTVLNMLPTLCSELYVIGRKPAAPTPRTRP